MMMMAPSVVQQQDTAGVKPPDEGGMQLNPAAARLASERKQKAAGGGQASAEGGGGGPTAAQKCPRCDSMNTKFCYYNNYSLSQPRHFCKNCRRYWTKGGALRNVPIGGGCRKNKRINHNNPAGGSPGHSQAGKPIGQGHHQLRGGFEPLASSALASLDASSLLASMGPPPGLFSGGPSTSSFMNPPDVHHHPHHPHHHLGLTFSRLQESLRMGDHPGASAAPSTMFSLSPANHLLNLGSNSPGLQLPPSFDPASSFPTLNYPTNTTTSSAGKLADQTTPSLLFNHGGAADFSPFYESVSSTSAPIIPPVLEDHLSTFNSSNNSSSNNINMAPDQDAANNNSTQNSNNLRQQLHPNGLALQMLNDGGPGGQQADDGHADHHHHHQQHHHHHEHHQHQNNDNNNAITRGHAMLPGFEEETPESNMLRNIRGMKGKSMLSSAGAANNAAAAVAADIRALPLVDQWQGMSDSLFTPPPADNSLWNVSWPEMHAALAAGSTAAGAMLH